MGNEKAHYELHFLIPDDKCSEAKEGELWLASDGDDEPFLVKLSGLYSRGRLIHGTSIHGDVTGHDGENLRRILEEYARKMDES